MSRPTPIPPGPGQESVWDYPRPPAIAESDALVVVRFNGRTLCETRRSVRVLETSHPPTYYLPLEDADAEMLVLASGQSFCEWKGMARYWDVTAGERVEAAAAWGYPSPTSGYETLADRFSVYPHRMESCTVDGVEVRPQAGGFYGGWITPDVVGPFKGEPGSRGW